MVGRFITLEGGEGAGKSTQIDRLRRHLQKRGLRVLCTREPGGSERAELIRTSILGGEAQAYGPFAEALMFSAARHDHLERTIRPALASGTWVVCDRFADSTRAYQGAMGEIDQGIIAALERLVVSSTRPDLTLILDVPAALGLARASGRRQARGEDADRYERENAAFHGRLRQAFLDIAKREPERCVIVDASGEADLVEAAITRAVDGRFFNPDLRQGLQVVGEQV
jgi:dTMP kinase